MGEENFDPKESLLLIESMINRAKDKFAEDGHLYLLWGWIVFICSVTQFILLHFFNSPYHYIVWFFSLTVFIYQAYYMRKKNKRRKVRTYTDYIIGYVWITFAIVIFLIAFVLGQLSSDNYYEHISPTLLALYGMPVFLSGIIIKFKPLIVASICCWLLSIVTTFIHTYDYQMLMPALAMLIAWIIPGYLLRAKYRSQ